MNPKSKSIAHSVFKEDQEQGFFSRLLRNSCHVGGLLAWSFSLFMLLFSQQCNSKSACCLPICS